MQTFFSIIGIAATAVFLLAVAAYYIFKQDQTPYQQQKDFYQKRKRKYEG